MKKYGEAEARFRQAVEFAPYEAEYRSWLGQALIALMYIDEGLNQLAEAARLDSAYEKQHQRYEPFREYLAKQKEEQAS